MVILRSGQDTAVHAALQAETSDDGSSFPFLRLPLELREKIYRMLLTTAYTYKEPSVTKDFQMPYIAGDLGYSYYPLKGRFDLGPSILLANQQIYVEAKRILYMENDFAIFKINCPTVEHWTSEHGAWRTVIPAFERLPEEMVPSPALRIVIEPLTEEEMTCDKWFTVITTAEGIPGVMCALWRYASSLRYYQQMSLVLEFHNDAPSRRQSMRERFLGPWMHIQGFGKVSLTGDIGEEMGRDIEEIIAQGPRPDELAYQLEQISRKAKERYDRGEFAAAQYQWVYMRAFWLFSSLRTPYTRKKYARVDYFKATIKSITQAVFRLIVLNIANQDYRRAEGEAEHLLHWSETYSSLEDPLEPVFKAKVQLCRLFSLTASRRCSHRLELRFLHYAVTSLLRSPLFADRNFAQLQNEVRFGINNSLIKLGCRHRCGRKKLACDVSKGGPGWETRAACRSFWDWLDVPEE